MLALWLKNHYQAVRYGLHALCALPLLLLMARWQAQALGANPLEYVLHSSGRSALQLLALTLCVTPLRRVLAGASAATHRRWGKRLADWNWLVRLRRPLGLWSFAYAAMHAAFYLHFDLGYDTATALDEIQQKPYLLAGLGTLLLLLLLALTSPQAMVRRLGRQWRRLHRLVYLAALMALLHFWWLVKPGLWTPWPETLALGLLLGYRAALWVSLLPRWDGCDGSESLQRATGPHRPSPA